MHKKILIVVFLFLGFLNSSAQPYLFGATSAGGSVGNGVLYKFNVTTSTYTVLYNMGGGSITTAVDAINPEGSLMEANDGNFYGMSYLGGKNNDGVIYKYNPVSNIYDTVKSFSTTSTGNKPFLGGTLIQTSAISTVLYGMTNGSGTNNDGTIFSYDYLTGVFTKLHDFTAGGSLLNRDASLYYNVTTGLLYGLQSKAGTLSWGELFSINTNGTAFTDLRNFNNTPDSGGSQPNGVPVLAYNGTDSCLYGTTNDDGLNNDGSVWNYDLTTHVYTKMHDFTGSGAGKDGSNAYGGLIFDKATGLLYGLESAGGTNNDGTLFSITPNSPYVFTVLHNFGGAPDGINPEAPLLLASDGNLYGTTNAGGANGFGTIFEWKIGTGTYSKLYNFATATGKNPTGSNLIEYFIDNSPLPITLSSFTATYIEPGNSVIIDWTAAIQLNNKEFIVEKSTDGVEYSTVGTLPGALTTSLPKSYSLTDYSPTPGVSYYRLKQVDVDGHYTVFSPVMVSILNMPENSQFVLFPNPVKLLATLNYNSLDANPIDIKVIDMFGETLSHSIVNNIQRGTNNIQLNTSMIAGGIYILQITADNKVFYKKFIKQ